ncbi:MAG: hypothetical protein AM326_04110 [Candidatus Thorarchaeota archaeon SMTZ-45]|nr:MAG: hypothetical protein AM326_04110 [Candidatus Thorarchaeota archaeon SMTZ-45]KXH72598.1 MAG: hypothetical protein AM325_00780 [Candidatus Thorarchaeota archaeon SMTZ1-45]
MNTRNLPDLAGVTRGIVLFGVFQFFFLTFLAAFFYPGGYDYFNYYFSELGAVLAGNSEANTVSATLFFIALTTVSITLILFWLGLLKHFNKSRIENILSFIGSGMGLLCTPLLIGVALNPIDTQLETHFVFVMAHFILFSLAILVYSIVFIVNRQKSWHFALLGLIVLTLGVFLMVNPMSPNAAFLQKVIVYSYFIWVGTLTWFLEIHTKRKTFH